MKRKKNDEIVASDVKRNQGCFQLLLIIGAICMVYAVFKLLAIFLNVYILQMLFAAVCAVGMYKAGQRLWVHDTDKKKPPTFVSEESPESIQKLKRQMPFLLHRRHQSILDGTARKLHAVFPEKGEVIAGFILYVMPLVMIHWISGELFTALRIEAVGIPTRGTQISCQIEQPQKGQNHTRFFHTYQYVSQTVPYRTYRKTNSQVESCEDLPNGDIRDIWYLPEDPQQSSIGKSTWTSIGSYVILILVGAPVSLLGMAGAAGIALNRKTTKQFNRLEKEGVLIDGRVLSSELGYGRNGPHITIIYEFTTPEGYLLSNESFHIRYDLKTLPRPGTRIVVIYADKTCYKLL